MAAEASAQADDGRRVAAYARSCFTPWSSVATRSSESPSGDGAFYGGTNYEAPNYRVMKSRAGSLQARGLARARGRNGAKLDYASVLAASGAARYLNNASSQIQIRSLEGKPLRQIELPVVGSTGGLVVIPTATKPTSPSLVHGADQI